jgi:hypothetical protein
MRKAIVALLSASALLLLAAGPAAAINDRFAPGDECSESSAAIGHPGGEPATDNAEDHGADNPVDGIASQNNPGNAQTENDTSADAEAHEQGSDNCTNAPAE